jgi:Ca-activated chloride channel family protein
MVAIDDDLDEELLSEVARVTEGRYFRASSLQELKDIYDTINGLEKSELKLPDMVSRVDLYHWPLAAAALLLVFDLVLSNTWLLRWP